MPRSPRPRLEHVLKACDSILTFIAGKTFADYEADDLLRSAVERQFTIIGEALRAAEHIDPAIAGRITGFRDIIDFRNVLAHDYVSIYAEGVWDIIHRHLSLLRSEVEALLAS